MKSKLILILVLSSLAAIALTAGAASNSKKAPVGTWNLRSKKCVADGTFLEKLTAQMTRVDRMVYPGEILIISENGAIRKFDDQAELVSEGNYVMSNQKQLLVQTKSGAIMPKSVKISTSYGDQLTTEHKNDPNCKGGIVKSSYLKVRTYPHYHYEQSL